MEVMIQGIEVMVIMKKTLLTFSFLFATLFVFAQTTTDETFDENAPAFQFEEEVIDYGKIEQNADGIVVDASRIDESENVPLN